MRAKTPLAEVFFLPGNGARKLDGAELMWELLLLQSLAMRQKTWWWCQEACWRLLMKQKWPASWKTPREGFYEYSSKVFPQLRNQGMSIRRGRSQYDWRWCLLACDSSGQFIGRLVRALLCERQRGTCTQHNQILCSQLTMRLSISPVCCKQRNECIEWKIVIVCE